MGPEPVSSKWNPVLRGPDQQPGSRKGKTVGGSPRPTSAPWQAGGAQRAIHKEAKAPEGRRGQHGACSPSPRRNMGTALNQAKREAPKAVHAHRQGATPTSRPRARSLGKYHAAAGNRMRSKEDHPRSGGAELAKCRVGGRERKWSVLSITIPSAQPRFNRGVRKLHHAKMAEKQT